MAQIPATNRRAMLRGSAAVLLAATVAAPAQPEPPVNAELLAACVAFAAAAREMARLEPIADDAVFEPANAAVHTALIRVSGLRARTTAGVQAKAAVCRAALALDEPSAMTGRFDVETRRHDVLAWSLLSDMAEVGA